MTIFEIKVFMVDCFDHKIRFRSDFFNFLSTKCCFASHDNGDCHLNDVICTCTSKVLFTDKQKCN